MFCGAPILKLSKNGFCLGFFINLFGYIVYPTEGKAAAAHI